MDEFEMMAFELDLQLQYAMRNNRLTMDDELLELRKRINLFRKNSNTYRRPITKPNEVGGPKIWATELEKRTLSPLQQYRRRIDQRLSREAV